MSEKKEPVIDQITHCYIRNEMFVPGICLDNELSLQPLPTNYPEQNIIVEVPIINGEPPAVLSTSRNLTQHDFLISKNCFAVSTGRGEHSMSKDEGVQSFQKEEQTKRRREQNRFRMRALRASDSKVAQRLRERNKFRMRTLRASDSNIALSLRERNKFRMREMRSAESHIVQNYITSSFRIKDGQQKLELCLQDRHSLDISQQNNWREEIQKDFTNINGEANKQFWVCLGKDQIETRCAESNELSNDVDIKHCSFSMLSKNKPYAINNTKIRKEVCCGVSVTDCLACTNSEVNETVKNANVADGIESLYFSKAGYYQKIKSEDRAQEKDRLTHCMGICSDIQEPHGGIKDIEVCVNQKVISEIEVQIERRRERGRLRMRLKRHSETEEEAERRRERGRLRMRMLRASESDEQAAKRRELNRLRMRMKRKTLNQ